MISTNRGARGCPPRVERATVIADPRRTPTTPPVGFSDRTRPAPAEKAEVDAPAEEADLCPVCAAPIMERTRVLAACRHEFCFGCISREVDARGRCPLDRLRLDRSMLERIDT